MAITRPAAIGTEDLRPWRKVARYGANPVNGGYAFDFRAASLGIDAGMHTTPFGSCAACCGIANSQWQALLLLTTTVRPLVASWRLPTWQNDDPRPVPRPQLCCMLGAGVRLSGGSAALDKLLKRRGRAAEAANHHLPGCGDRAADAGRMATLRPPFGHCGAVAGHGSQLDWPMGRVGRADGLGSVLWGRGARGSGLARNLTM